MSADNGTAARQSRSSALLLILLAGAVLAATWPALSADLVYDDLRVIRQNPRITSLANWPEAFSATYWEFLKPEVAVRIGYWRPLATLTHTFVYVLFDGSTRAFHAANLGVHLLAVLAAFRLTRRLTGSLPTSFFAALLFGLHPINVESWAWVSALNGLLAGLFGLLALQSHLGWREGGSRGVPWRSGLFFALALLSKETAVAVLPMAVAVDLARPGTDAAPRLGFLDRLRPIARSYAPLALALLGYYVARAFVFHSLSAGLERVTTDFGPDVDALRLARLRVELMGGGLVQDFAPNPSLFRPFRPVIPASDPTFLRDLAALVGAVICSVLAWRKREHVAFAGIGIALAALLPMVLRVTSLGSFPLADRFLYLSTFGAALLVAHLLSSKRSRGVSFVVLSLLALYLGQASHARAETWSSGDALFAAAVNEAPESPYVHWGQGRVALERFQAGGDPHDLLAALASFETAADLLERALAGDSSIFATRQDAEQTNVGLGWCYLFEADLNRSEAYGTAEQIFELALKSSPTSESAYTGLGVALQAQLRFDEARRAYNTALELNPRFVEAHHNLAQLYLQQRQWPLAQRHLELALELRPDHFEDLILLARAQFERSYTDRAKQTAERAHELDPSSPEPFEIMAVIAGAEGDSSTAMANLDEALRLAPNYGRVHYLRANEFLRKRDTASALASLRRACDLMPTDFAAHHDLGALLHSQGAIDAALPFLTRAYELCTDEARLSLMRRTLESLQLEDAAAPLAWARADRMRGDQNWTAKWTEFALAADPESVPALTFRANQRERSGDLAGAASDLETVLEMEPRAFNWLVELGRLRGELGERERARALLQQALEGGPPDEWEAGLRSAARTRAERMLKALDTPETE